MFQPGHILTANEVNAWLDAADRVPTDTLRNRWAIDGQFIIPYRYTNPAIASFSPHVWAKQIYNSPVNTIAIEDNSRGIQIDPLDYPAYVICDSVNQIAPYGPFMPTGFASFGFQPVMALLDLSSNDGNWPSLTNPNSGQLQQWGPKGVALVETLGLVCGEPGYIPIGGFRTIGTEKFGLVIRQQDIPIYSVDGVVNYSGISFTNTEQSIGLLNSADKHVQVVRGTVDCVGIAGEYSCTIVIQDIIFNSLISGSTGWDNPELLRTLHIWPIKYKYPEHTYTKIGPRFEIQGLSNVAFLNPPQTRIKFAFNFGMKLLVGEKLSFAVQDTTLGGGGFIGLIDCSFW